MITITDNAKAQFKHLLNEHNEKAVKLSLKSTGCSGHSYDLDFSSLNKYDELIDDVLIVEAKSIMFLLGTEIDWVDSQFGAHFVFNNPNVKNECGCGSSVGF